MREKSTANVFRVMARHSWGHRRICIRCAALFVLVFCTGAIALALDPHKNIDQYGHEIWTSQNGLPGEAVYQILQTSDGYLWLRTSTGLVRFDGVRFVAVAPRVGSAVVEEPVKAIAKGVDGDLLVRTTTRTLICKDGVFADYRKPAPLPDGDIRVLFESQRHEVFLGSDDFIYLIEDSGAKMLRRGSGWSYDFLNNPDGSVWAAASSIITYDKGRVGSFELGPTGSTRAFLADGDKRIWLATASGLFEMDRDARVTRAAMRDFSTGMNALVRDRAGSLWIATDAAGIMRFAGGRTVSFQARDGLRDRRG